MIRQLLTFVFFVSSIVAFAGEDKCIPEKPRKEQLVNNLSKAFPDFLNASEFRLLENKLEEFDRQTKIQIAVIIVDDLCGYEAGDYTARLGDKWGISGYKNDKDKKGLGCIILIKPTDDNGGRDVFLATGYAMEEFVPDLIAQKIVNEILIPNLKAGNYFAALNDATDKIIEYTKNPPVVTDDDSSSGSDFDDITKDLKWWHYVIIIIVVIVFLSIRGGGGGFTMRSGGYGGGFGGGGGGSFRGFGGSGGFGGGGAGGKW